MGGTRQADEAVAWYCHYRLTKLMAETKKKQSELADDAGLPRSAVNHLLRNGGGTGLTTAAGFAKMFDFKTRGALVDAADRWWDSRDARKYAQRAQAEMERLRRIKDLDESGEIETVKKSRPETA